MRRVAGGRVQLRDRAGGGADPGVSLALGGGRGGAGFCFAFAFAFVVGVGVGGGGAGPGVAVLLPAVLRLEVGDSARALAFSLAFLSTISGWAKAEGREDESP